MVRTHLAIWMKPQEAAACSGVQPSLSPLLTSLPLSTRNCTISAFSSMQACQRTHSHMMKCYKHVYCCESGGTCRKLGRLQWRGSSSRLSLVCRERPSGCVQIYLTQLQFSLQHSSSTGTKIMTTVSTPHNDFVKRALKYFPKHWNERNSESI